MLKDRSIINGLKKLFIKIQKRHLQVTPKSRKQTRRQSDRIKQNTYAPQFFNETTDLSRSPSTSPPSTSPQANKTAEEKFRDREWIPDANENEDKGTRKFAKGTTKRYSISGESPRKEDDEAPYYKLKRALRNGQEPTSGDTDQMVEKVVRGLKAELDGKSAISRKRPRHLDLEFENKPVDGNLTASNGLEGSLGVLSAKTSRISSPRNMLDHQPPRSPVNSLPSKVVKLKLSKKPTDLSPSVGIAKNETGPFQIISTEDSSRPKLYEIEPLDAQQFDTVGFPGATFEQRLDHIHAIIDANTKRGRTTRNLDRIEPSAPKRLKIGNDMNLPHTGNCSPKFVEKSFERNLSRPVTSHRGSQTLSTGPLLETEQRWNKAEEHQAGLYIHDKMKSACTQTQDSTGHSTDQLNSVAKITQLVHFFILKRKSPRVSWINWPDANLAEETIDSTFEAVYKYGQITVCDSLEIKIETKEQEHIFSISRSRPDHFDNMKQCMINEIKVNSMTTTIRIIPNPNTEEKFEE